MCLCGCMLGDLVGEHNLYPQKGGRDRKKFGEKCNIFQLKVTTDPFPFLYVCFTVIVKILRRGRDQETVSTLQTVVSLPPAFKEKTLTTLLRRCSL